MVSFFAAFGDWGWLWWIFGVAAGAFISGDR